MVSAGRGETLQQHRWDVDAFLNWLNAFCFFVFFAGRAPDQTVLSTQCCVIPANSQIICLPARSSVSAEPQKPFSYSKLLNCCASVCVCAVMDESGGILPSPPPLRQAAEIV